MISLLAKLKRIHIFYSQQRKHGRLSQVFNPQFKEETKVQSLGGRRRFQKMGNESQHKQPEKQQQSPNKLQRYSRDSGENTTQSSFMSGISYKCNEMIEAIQSSLCIESFVTTQSSTQVIRLLRKLIGVVQCHHKQHPLSLQVDFPPTKQDH